MCEKKGKKTIKKNSQIMRAREDRRHQRIQQLQPMSPPPAQALSAPESEQERSLPAPLVPPKTIQNKALIELAWRTIGLAHRNRQIQEKIVELQRETTEFITSVMTHPDNRQRYLEHVRIYLTSKQEGIPVEAPKSPPKTVKVDPN